MPEIADAKAHGEAAMMRNTIIVPVFAVDLRTL
jgi:hypothetical protein